MRTGFQHSKLSQALRSCYHIAYFLRALSFQNLLWISYAPISQNLRTMDFAVMSEGIHHAKPGVANLQPSTYSVPLIAVSSCSPGWSWPNQSPGPSSQMVIWMTCCCYLFHLLHQTFHLLVRRSSIKFHIDWIRIVNCVFYSNKCISGVRPPQLWLFFLLHSRFKKLLRWRFASRSIWRLPDT